MKGIPAKKVLLHHYCIDNENSNSYEVWKKICSPQQPTQEQIAQLQKAGQLQLLTSPEWVNAQNGEAVIQMELPRHGVSLFSFSW